jgi:hypothetical protein
MIFLRIAVPLYLLFEHDLFGKPVPASPDHALAAAQGINFGSDDPAPMPIAGE